jgi:Kef-type K+ transport system membrane component KefB
MAEDLLLAFQVALVIIAAKGLGRLFERKLSQPAVIGEVLAGVLIGPFALGGISIPALSFPLLGVGPVHLPAIGPLFPLAADGSFSQGMLRPLTLLGAVILMFDAGLETDLKRFLSFAPAGLSTGLGGAVLSFAMGTGIAVWTGFASGYTDPRALVLGTVAVATSVGLTVRVLSDSRKLNTPEGATVLSAAVIDDVIGLVFLSLMLGVVTSSGGVSVPWGTALLVIGRAAAVFVGLLAIGLLFRRRLSRFLRRLGSIEAAGASALALGLLAAGLAEASGLALVVGAYVMGLSLSSTDVIHVLRKALEPVRELLVPILFCVTGMMADMRSVIPVLAFGAVYTVATGLGKIVGCGLPAMPFGFTVRGALRIGVAMLPRQEVGLIVAGIALQRGLINNSDMGAVIVMVLATAVASPPALIRLFRDGGSGYRGNRGVDHSVQSEIRFRIESPDFATLLADLAADGFRKCGYFVHELPLPSHSWDIRRECVIIEMTVEGSEIVMVSPEIGLVDARIAFAEALRMLRASTECLAEMSEARLLECLYYPCGEKSDEQAD